MPLLFVRILCFAAAAASGVVLLLKVYGVTEMAATVPQIVVPCGVGLIIVWWIAARRGIDNISAALAIGLLGGLASTLAYDATRLPFHLAGYLVFATNSTYGMWISDAAASSRFTETIGWLYHFSNGITFAIMYALFMRGRHWSWGIVYAFALETIAIFSNFGQVFALAGNYGMIGIAYLAHISYGLPIGLMVWRWDASRAWISRNRTAIGIVYVVFLATFLIPVLAPENIARDRTVAEDTFRVAGTAMIPFMRRIERGQSLTIVNPGATDVSVLIVKTGEIHPVATGDSTAIAFPAAGIFQIYVETEGPTTSSFVLVEPVADTAPPEGP